MGLIYSPGIVRNGLISCLDASDINSYIGSGNTWFDLSYSGNNGELINGPMFNNEFKGNITFDGVNDYVVQSSLNPTNFTCDITFSSTASSGYIIRKINYGWGIWINSTGSITAWVDTDTNHRSTSKVFSYSGITNIVLTFGDSTIKIFKNGELISTTNTTTNSVYSPVNGIYIGSDGPTAGFLNGKIYSYKLYNRVLTTKELQQNYQQYKTRFNLY